MKKLLIALTLLALSPNIFAAAHKSQPNIQEYGKPYFSVEIFASSPAEANYASLMGALTFMDHYTVGFGIPAIYESSAKYAETTEIKGKTTVVPFTFRYEGGITAQTNYVLNNEVVYYYIENEIMDKSDKSFGYAFEFGFAHQLSASSKLLFLTTAYRYLDPSIGSASDYIKVIFSGGKIAYQHRF